MLTIDTAAITANYNIVRDKLADGCQMAAVVKADCYGLGMKNIIPLLEAQNCPLYYVATAEEAIQLRGLTAKTIAPLNGVYPECAAAFAEHDITPVLNSIEQIECWKNTAQSNGITLPAILHFDTAMNRLGLRYDDPLPDTEGLNIKIVMSHFASSEEKDNSINQTQFDRFMSVARHYPDTAKGICNSSGIFLSPDYHLQTVRPGMALYGLNPSPYAPNPMQAAVKLTAPVRQIKKARKGEATGYNETYRFDEDSVLAVVECGYADGLHRTLSNKGNFYYNGSPCPVVGRVSMDLMCINITNVPNVKIGDDVEILGPHQSADDLAAALGTIGYEILTSLGHRYKRVYL